MAARVDINGGFESTDEKGLFDTTFDPVILRSKNGDIFLAEMVALFAGMLQHCRLILAKSIHRGGLVLLEAGCCSPLGFPNIPAWAWCRVGTSAGYVVYLADLFFFL